MLVGKRRSVGQICHFRFHLFFGFRRIEIFPRAYRAPGFKFCRRYNPGTNFIGLLDFAQLFKQRQKNFLQNVGGLFFRETGAARGEKNLYSPASEADLEAEMANLPDASPLADERLIELEQQHLIRAALGQLEERCQTILSMIYLRDAGAASYAEVARKIGVGETSISPLRARCLKKLAKILK